MDHTETSNHPPGIRCLSDTTSSLHVSDIFPGFGAELLRTVRKEWSFGLSDNAVFSESPEISFIIPHRGTDRESQLHAVIHSLARMNDSIECIVVEQDERRQLGPLPGNTRYLHLPHPEQPLLWHKCLAYNAGVELARGRIVVCHDGDILVPAEYCREIRRLLDQENFEVAWPQRFLFYLSQSTTRQILELRSASALDSAVPEQVKQNWVGGTLAITKSAFHAIGGFDTRFTGWTGEDREFYDRCQLLRGWFFGYIPFIHLWHPSQRGRVDLSHRECRDDFIRSIMDTRREDRVQQLLDLAGRES